MWREEAAYTYVQGCLHETIYKTHFKVVEQMIEDFSIFEQIGSQNLFINEM